MGAFSRRDRADLQRKDEFWGRLGEAGNSDFGSFAPVLRHEDVLSDNRRIPYLHLSGTGCAAASGINYEGTLCKPQSWKCANSGPPALL